MSFKEVLNRAKEFPIVLVSGPQRSGTTITGKVLAYELNYEYIDENRFGVDNVNKLNPYLSRENIVIQCPALMHHIHNIYNQIKGKAFLVVCMRNITDIIVSQKRIGWCGLEQAEKNKYVKDHILSKYIKDKNLPVSTIKYNVWDQYQANLVEDDHWSFFYYDYLKGHSMFIPKQKRKNFKPKQTK